MDEYIKREDALDAVLFALVGTGLQSRAKNVKEKPMNEQIEEINELTTVLYEANHKKSVLDYRWLATEAYNAGYRKQREGEWKDQYQGMYVNQLYKCSVCGETAFHDDKRWYLTKFCPNCGAKMKGE